jgi:hypothetical protein
MKGRFCRTAEDLSRTAALCLVREQVMLPGGLPVAGELEESGLSV